MKPRTMILLVVAVICGLAASYMTTRLLANRPPAEPKVEVWVVKAPDGIKPQTKIDKPEEMFEKKPFPADSAPKAALQPKDEPNKPHDKQDPFWQLRGKYLNKFLAKDQFVTERDFQSGENRLQPPKGYTMTGIPADAEKNAGGFVLPNSRVDVIWTEEKDGGRRKTRIVLENVLVLAVDAVKERSNDQNKDKTVAAPSTVTLAVTTQDVKKLTYWQQRGKIRLALRSPEDMTPPIKSEGTEDPGDPEAVAPEAAKKAKEMVEVAVAAEDLKAGTKLEKKHFKTKKFLKEDAPKNAIADAKKLEGRTLEQPVATDEFLCEADFKPGEKPLTQDQGENGGKDKEGRQPPEERKTHKIRIVNSFNAQEFDVKGDAEKKTSKDGK